MSLSGKEQFINEAIADRKKEHRFRQLNSFEPRGVSVISDDGQALVNFSGNDYLGLSRHPEVVARSKKYADQYRRRSRLILQEMINALEINPEKVLRNFHEKCYAPQEVPKDKIKDFNHQLLLDDLRRLQNVELDLKKLKNVDKICILHGSEDEVVPHKKGRQIFTQLQARAKYFEIKGAGHALPFTHSWQCLEFVAPEISELAETNF